MNPYGENYYDGITLDPFEVVFVKVKELLLERDWSYAVHAAKYDSWLSAQVSYLSEPKRACIIMPARGHPQSIPVSVTWKFQAMPRSFERASLFFYRSGRGSFPCDRMQMSMEGSPQMCGVQTQAKLRGTR